MGIIIPYHKTDNYIEIDDKEPTLDPQYMQPPNLFDTHLNLSSGMDAYCLDTIVQHQDLMDACKQSKKQQDEGQSVSDRLEKSKG